jgi:ferric-dicitrate binding protein FerR (iron transport regulator)
MHMDEAELINELLELTLAWQRGDATAEERARLERLLADNPRAPGWYLRIVDDSLTLLDAAAAGEAAGTRTHDTFHRLEAERVTPSTSARVLHRVFGRRSRWALGFTLAVCFAVAFVGLALDRLADSHNSSGSPAAAAGTARVVDISNVVWAAGAKTFAEWSLVKAGDRFQFESGWMNLFLDNGGELLIEGPADVEFISSKKIFARQGKLAARISPGAVGFRIDTPHAKVIDRGTAFGLSVDGESHTSVVVYEGMVDLDVVGTNAPPRRRLESGEALSVNREGQLSRITTVQRQEFLEPPQIRMLSREPNCIIASVNDNVRSLQTAKYYRVIPQGFVEDCRAYVDRLHEWNGVDGRGLPPFLLGGDYVMTFNDDKIATDISIAVTLTHPANVFVLIDDRVPPADWLKRDFVDTGWDVGADEGYVGRDIQTTHGSGQSIDHVYSVWQRKVPRPDTIVLGALGMEQFKKPARDVERSMYGIVVTPLRNSANF